MSRLENLTKTLLQSLIQGEQAILDSNQQKALALWAVKTAMVEAGRNAKAVEDNYTPEELKNFRVSEVIPDYTRVWIGRSATRAFALTSSGLAIRTGPAISRAIITTIVMGHVAFQVFSIHVSTSEKGPYFDIHVRKGEWEQLLNVIWPTEGSTSNWPPQHAFTSDEGPSSLTSLRQRFRR